MRAFAKHIYLQAPSILVAALVVFCASGLVAKDVFDHVRPFDINDPESEFVAASDRVEEALGRTAEPEVIVMALPSDGQPLPEAVESRLASVPGIAEVTGPGRDPDLETSDGGYLVIGYAAPDVTRVDTGEAVAAEFDGDTDLLVGGTAVAAQQVGERSEQDTRRIELLAAPVIFLLLLFVFRTLVAALLPLAIAALSIALTFATLRILAELTTIDLFALQTVTGLGTGLAINYSLFVISRYREELLQGGSFRTALELTLRTAGRTVMFSAITVAAALTSLLVFPQPFLSSTGIAGALTALFAGITALLVLPAALTVLGPSINSFAVRDLPQSRPEVSGGLWRRLPGIVCRSPIPSLVLGAAVMIALAVQVQGAEVTTPDARALPESDSARQVSESLSAFPGIAPTRLYAVLDGTSDGSEVADALTAIPAVTDVSKPQSLPDGSTLVSIEASSDPLSDAGGRLVEEIRADLPAGAVLGGRAAEQVDQRDSIRERVLLALVVLLVTNLITLALMTGSAVLPLLAVAMNLLTVSAALGALNAVFTSDRMLDLLGASAHTGIDISVPVLVFAVTFGLATDYGIFLFARIREARETAASEEEAIIEGVATTGRLISASAVLMAVAVGAFVFCDLVIVQEFAVAIAVSVLIDATIVRGLIIPATLKLMGRHAWWRPGAGRAEADPVTG